MPSHQSRQPCNGVFSYKTEHSTQAYMHTILWWQGPKKVSFTACHSGKLYLACTSPLLTSTSPKTFFDWQDWLQSVCNLNFPKTFTGPSGKLRTEFTSPKPKSTSPGLSYMTFFVRWMIRQIFWEQTHLDNQVCSYKSKHELTFLTSLFCLCLLTFKVSSSELSFSSSLDWFSFSVWSSFTGDVPVFSCSVALSSLSSLFSTSSASSLADSFGILIQKVFLFYSKCIFRLSQVVV